MSSCRKQKVCGLVAALVLAPTLAFGQAEGVRWRNNLDAAKVEATQAGKLVLLHFWSPTCKPCQKLDQTVFPLPQVGAAIEKSYVPVKVNADTSPALAHAFRIDRVPTDIVITSQGNVVATLACPPTPEAYVAQLNNLSNHFRQQAGGPVNVSPQQQVNAAYAGLQATPQMQPNVAASYGNVAAISPASQNAMATTGTPAMPANAMPRSYRNPYTTSPTQGVAATGSMSPADVKPTAAVNQAIAASLATPAASVPQAGAQVQAASAQPTQTVARQAAPNSRLQLPPGSPQLGFEGYCPVTLKFAKKWVRGDVRYGAIHRGRTYLFAGEQERQQFLANPDSYSPVFSGMDPVVMLESKQSVEGSRKFGFEYRGAFYLFSSKETMQKFSSQPDHFAAGVRQAMRQLDTSAGTLHR